MQLRFSTLMPCALGAAVSMLGVSACNRTPAGFVAGSGANPLDGGVLNDGNGNSAELGLNDDGTALKTVLLNGGSTIEFDDTADGVIVPREISTGGGNSSLTVNRAAEEVTFSANVPIVGRVSFGGTVPQDLDATRNILFPRSAAQADIEADCDAIVAGIEEFCTRFEANQDASVEEVTAFAIDIAEESLGNSSANGVIEDLVADNFGVVDDFCNIFERAQQGSGDNENGGNAAVDFCESVRGG